MATSAAQPPPPLSTPTTVLRGGVPDRELSQLAQLWRVLSLALEPTLPLLERLQFATVASAALDAFFEIRVARLKRRLLTGTGSTGDAGVADAEILAAVQAACQQLVAMQNRVLLQVVLPALAEQGIRLPLPSAWTPAQHDFARCYFDDVVLPVLTPIGLDPAHPFPHVQSRQLNLLVTLTGEDAFGRHSGIAVVQAPRCLPRVLALPSTSGEAEFALLTTIMQQGMPRLFPGMSVKACVPFRVTRDSDLWLFDDDRDAVRDLLAEDQRRRRHGRPVRLEVAADCPQDTAWFLLAEYGLHDNDLYRVTAPVNAHRLASLRDLAQRPELCFAPYQPREPVAVADSFARLRSGDAVVLQPHEVATPVLGWLQAAATDAAVVSVRHSLFRATSDGPVVDALVAAARAGKQVLVVVELRARLEEAASLRAARRLQQAGAEVVMVSEGPEVHAQVALVVRRELDGLRPYVHLFTGDQQLDGDRAAVDLSLLSADPELAQDVEALFDLWCGIGQPRPLGRLWASPLSLREQLLRAIAAEAEHARAGRPARILARVNALTDARVIAALVRAAEAGVDVDLLVRGPCCVPLRSPGPGRIRVRAVLGRFVEHARAAWFANGGEPQLLCGTGDWTERTFDRRVDVWFPIMTAELRDDLLTRLLLAPWRDARMGWQLQVDGRWQARRSLVAWPVGDAAHVPAIEKTAISDPA